MKPNYRPILAASLMALALSACDSSSPSNSGVSVGGGASGGSSSGSSGGANFAPTAKNDVGFVGANSSNNPVNVLANDTDPNGDPLTITNVSVTSLTPTAKAGTEVVSISGGTLRYTPPIDFIGQQALLYTISDGRGGTSQAVALITVSPLQVPPAALSDIFTVTGGSSNLNVLANDLDNAGGGLTLVSASSTLAAPPTSSSISIVNNQIRYTPNAGYVGAETIQYTLRDTNGATATAVAVVTVLPVAAPPLAVPDAATTSAGQNTSIDVRSNDVDFSGGGLSLVSVAPVASVPPGATGGFAVSGNVVTYTAPNPTFVGVQTAQYTVRDGNGQTATGLITLVVSPIALSPPP